MNRVAIVESEVYTWNDVWDGGVAVIDQISLHTCDLYKHISIRDWSRPTPARHCGIFSGNSMW